jgi:hypothetical protein
MIIPFRRPTPPASQPHSPPASRAEDLAKAEAAADALAQMLRHAYTDRDNRIHAPTIIGGAAALTGEFALRAAGIPLPKIGFVFGDPINAILFEGGDDQATLWEIIETTASALGLAKQDLPDAREIFGRIAAAAAAIMQHRGSGTVFPPLSIPDEHYPTEWSPNAGPRLRGAVQEIAARHRLTPRQTALALGMATGNLIHQGKDLLPTKIAFQLAVEVMFATAKMAPLTDRIQ